MDSICFEQQQSCCKEENAIGPALETFLTVIGIVLLALAGVALLTKPFWKRIATYFRRWWERDMRAEQLRREEAECRRKARQEVSELCHDDILQGKAANPNAQNAQTEALFSREGAVRSGEAAEPPPVATLRLTGSNGSSLVEEPEIAGTTERDRI